jgi:hypothetical protein
MNLQFDKKKHTHILKFDKNENNILIDCNQMNILTTFFLNHTTKIQFDKDDRYPYYLKNKKQIYLLQLLFGYKFENQTVKFKNKNQYDLSGENLTIMHKYIKHIIKKYKIKKYIMGHWATVGSEAYVMKNPIWITDDNKYIMYLNKNTHTVLCEKSYNKILEYETKNNEKLSFYIGIGGFPMCKGNIYMVEIIIGNSRKDKTSYHIDGDTLNNTYDNLNCYDNLYCNDENHGLEDYESIIIYRKLLKIIKKNYSDITIISYEKGKNITKGHTSGKKNVNSKFIIFDEKLKQKYVLMDVGKNKFTKISYDKLKIINKCDGSLHLHSNGYVAIHTNGAYLYLHQIITNYYGNKGNNMSVDHINRDKLDNRTENLRITTQSIQNSNQDKRSRKYNAQVLPAGITQEMMPKYCYYCSENMKSETMGDYTRDFFRVEKHPKLTVKAWSTTKSTKVSILDKLKEAKRKLDELDGIVKEKYKLPKGIIKKDKPNNKIQLVYDANIDGERRNLRATYSNYEESKLSEYVKNFQEKIKKKYSN